MDRRTFLKATLASAGSIVAGACSDDTGGGGTADGGVDTGGDVGADGDLGGDMTPEILDGSAFFPQSVASGDPRADSVILWTRVEDADQAQSDVELTLQVALDDQFTELVELNGGSSLSVTAAADFDHCVKVKLTELESATDYYYRFVHEVDGALYGSRTGRARTAPGADDDRAVRFAYASCQDYNGRYYNAYRLLAEQDLDFFVHLGDYVYETTGDPGFQDTTPDRVVTFTDEANAIAFFAGTENEFFAARSLSNYRDLYKVYRSDPHLQTMHERFPMIAVWDDHEFSDDCYGATATYSDGALDETDVERRKAANQAWFEYMPVDYIEEDFAYDPEADYPDDITIYREIEYGANLHLVMTDLRTYRPDHLVPEDAMPGAIALDETALTATVGALPEFAVPYVDIDSFQSGDYATILIDNAEALEIQTDKVTGNISVPFINDAIAALNEDLAPEDLLTPISEQDQAGLERGMAFSQMFKISSFGALGSRYFVLRDTFQIYAAARYAATSGASEDMMGADQEAWFLETMQGSDRTWKVWANEFCLTERTVDLRGINAVPPALQQRFQLSAEDWDGTPNKRDEILDALSALDNVVAITGDIHAFFAGTPFVRNDMDKKIVELVGSSISSSPYQVLVARTVSSDPDLVAAGADQLALILDEFMTSRATRPNPEIGHVDIERHGFVVVNLESSTLEATFWALEQEYVTQNLDDSNEDLASLFERTRFMVNAGESELYQNIDGEWLRWDPVAYDWV